MQIVDLAQTILPFLPASPAFSMLSTKSPLDNNSQNFQPDALKSGFYMPSYGYPRPLLQLKVIDVYSLTFIIEGF